MFVKLCGLRTESDVTVAVETGADAVGFVLTTSPRQIDVELAARLVAEVPADVLTVAVVRGISATEAGEMALKTGVRALQLHGDYPRESFDELAELPFGLVRATALGPETDVRTGAFGEELLLIDSPVAGSGEQWDITRLAENPPTGTWVLAGGLSPETVAGAISVARPWGVDVSSGIESSRGVKDHGRMREFVLAARGQAAR
ncbi:phosphoribosylanthranilate isomerase [Lentzea albidocapillata subsp. violacea]|uniref:N-(5'-phosphoribosyl)anthranilate isomerase n=1 Tax=Lentzea albidocapillata subsp. violacea TaxID=128104 RepID=A0A1G9QR80_9PSEU|nr:phosphoribosylanthranilate isomerase [Lentzea albidocapillata]SDM13506.1 phosphoribosylanthranilate isomerase [Lentzea albidocapillata subsp. violacea]